MSDIQSPKIGNGKPGPGRGKGTPNKTTALLKDAILRAATDAGNGDLAEYLRVQALANPGPFLSLLGKVLPLQISGDPDNPLTLVMVEQNAERFASGIARIATRTGSPQSDKRTVN